MLGAATADLPLDDPDRLNLLFAPVQSEKQIGLAVSGGVDSLALLLLVARWCALQESAPQVIVYTVDHGLRAAAKEETSFVAKLATDLGFEAQILRGKIDGPENGLQEKARALRYGLIGNAMQEQGIACLLTAHHSNDQAETVMMRLARGSGLSGLGGMAKTSVRHGMFVFRPFLDVPRSQLDAFIASSEHNPVHDPSNKDRQFERVRWRAFMPELEQAGVNAQMIGLSAMRVRRAEAALSEITEQIYEDQFVIDPFGCLYFDLEAFNHHPAEIGIRLLARALDDAGGATHWPALAQVEALYDHLHSGMLSFKGLTLGGCGVKVKDGLVQIFREMGRMDDKVVEVEPGKSVRWDNRFQIIAAQDLASPVCVSPAIEITRHMLDNMLPDHAPVPMQAVHAAPMIVVNGELLAVGEHVFGQGVDVFRVFGPNALI